MIAAALPSCFLKAAATEIAANAHTATATESRGRRIKSIELSGCVRLWSRLHSHISAIRPMLATVSTIGAMIDWGHDGTAVKDCMMRRKRGERRQTQWVRTTYIVRLCRARRSRMVTVVHPPLIHRISDHIGRQCSKPSQASRPRG